MKHRDKRLLPSSCLSFLAEQLSSHLADFHEIWCLFENLSRKSSFVKIWQNNGYFTWRPMYIYYYIYIYIYQLFLENILDKSWEENQDKFYLQSFFLRKSCYLWENLKRKHKLHRCISTATMVRRTRQNVALYIHCLSCYKNFIDLQIENMRPKEHTFSLTFCWPCIKQWFLVIVQLDAQILFNVFIYL